MEKEKTSASSASKPKKRKRAVNGRKKQNKGISPKVKTEIILMIIIMLSIISIISLFFDCSGIVCMIIKNVLKGMLGIGGFVLPIAALTLSIYLLVSEERIINVPKLVLGAFIVFIVMVFLHILTKKNMTFSEISEYLTHMYMTGSIYNGGIIGGVTGDFISKLIGKAGAYIVLTVLFICDIMIFTGSSVFDSARTFFGNMFKGTFDDVKLDYTMPDKENKEKDKEEKEEKKSDEAPKPKINIKEKLSAVKELFLSLKDKLSNHEYDDDLPEDNSEDTDQSPNESKDSENNAEAQHSTEDSENKEIEEIKKTAVRSGSENEDKIKIRSYLLDKDEYKIKREQTKAEFEKNSKSKPSYNAQKLFININDSKKEENMTLSFLTDDIDKEVLELNEQARKKKENEALQSKLSRSTQTDKMFNLQKESLNSFNITNNSEKDVRTAENTDTRTIDLNINKASDKNVDIIGVDNMGIYRQSGGENGNDGIVFYSGKEKPSVGGNSSLTVGDAEVKINKADYDNKLDFAFTSRQDMPQSRTDTTIAQEKSSLNKFDITLDRNNSENVREDNKPDLKYSMGTNPFAKYYNPENSQISMEYIQSLKNKRKKTSKAVRYDENDENDEDFVIPIIDDDFDIEAQKTEEIDEIEEIRNMPLNDVVIENKPDYNEFEDNEEIAENYYFNDVEIPEFDTSAQSIAPDYVDGYSHDTNITDYEAAYTEETEPSFEDAIEEDTEPSFEDAIEEDTEPNFEDAIEDDTEPSFEDAIEENTEPSFEDAVEDDTEPSFESIAEENREPSFEDAIEDDTEPSFESAAEDNTEPSFESIADDLPWGNDANTVFGSADEHINAAENQAEPKPVIVRPDEIKEVTEAAEEHREYVFPRLEFLEKNPDIMGEADELELMQNSQKLVNTLRMFKIEAKVIEISQGPTVTRYELTIEEGTKISKVRDLADNLAYSLAAPTIRIEAPIPGKTAVGIEIPNKEPKSVYLSEVICSEKFMQYKSKLGFGIGKDITGNVVIKDIAKMPHVLIAGTTGSGKSVCINTLITSILYKASPEDVRMILIDPKVVELSMYNDIPHLLVPVVTDPDKALGALNWAVCEMEDRFKLFETTKSRNLQAYNETAEELGLKKQPQIIIIVDEFADLMMTASKDIERLICRITQKARAAGIHLVVATQRPSTDVITGLIKSNIPSRIAFKTSNGTDSRTILDCVGAEKLIGRGDMLIKTVDMDKPLRAQCAFISDESVEKILDFIKANNKSDYNSDVIEHINNHEQGDDDSKTGSSSSGGSKSDSLIEDVIAFVVRKPKISTSFIQRQFGIGFNKAAKIMEELEDMGIVGAAPGGSKQRDVLMDKYQYEEWITRRSER